MCVHRCIRYTVRKEGKGGRGEREHSGEPMGDHRGAARAERKQHSGQIYFWTRRLTYAGSITTSFLSVFNSLRPLFSLPVYSFFCLSLVLFLSLSLSLIISFQSLPFPRVAFFDCVELSWYTSSASRLFLAPLDACSCARAY